MIIYIDMDDVLCDYSSQIREDKVTYPDKPFPQSREGFFRALNALPGAIDSVNELRAIESIDVYILTAPSALNPHSYTEKRLWVEEHFDVEFAHNLIICSNKGLLKGDILIDDHVEGRGQEHFEGKVLHFGVDYETWQDIMKALKPLLSNTRKRDSWDDFFQQTLSE